MGVHIMGITGMQWIISVALSFISLVVNLLLKFIDEKYFPELGEENKDDVQAAKADYANLLKFRKTKELSGSMRQDLGSRTKRVVHSKNDQF
jgi:hypothetical protein